MDPLLDDGQQSFQRSLRKFLETHWTDEQVRASMEGPNAADGTTWSRLAGELGVASLNIPEEFGGVGAAPVEGLLVAEELGRVLYGGPYLSTVVMAANAIVLSGDDALSAELLPSIAEGAVTATLALAESGRDRSAGAIPEAQQRGESWTLTGTVRRVIDGSTADRVLVEATTAAGRSLFLLDGEEGLERIAVETLDPTRRMATLELTAAPARLVGAAGGVPQIAARLRPIVSLALAAEAVGGAARCVETTAEYAKIRQQFGRPIGSFQAVKHRCAEMQVRLEGAMAGVRHAGRVSVRGDEDLNLISSVVKVFATQSYFRTAADTVQLHGGIGFTWEHMAHLHFKRAKSLELLGGSHQEHRAAIADVVLAPAG